MAELDREIIRKAVQERDERAFDALFAAMQAWNAKKRPRRRTSRSN